MGGHSHTLSCRTTREPGAAPALLLLKALISRPHRYAARDWLCEHLHNAEEDALSPGRLDDLASLLRGLLCPPLEDRESRDRLRRALLSYVHSASESGPGYRLGSYPLIWVDIDALSWYVEQACRLERFGEEALPLWEWAYELAKRGEYLIDEPYSDWAETRRAEAARYLRQSVHALARLYLSQEDARAEEEALRLLGDYWQQHVEDEDALRPLMELLGRHERYQEALSYYERLCDVLEEDGRTPDARTTDLKEFLSAKQLQRSRVPQKGESAGNGRSLPELPQIDLLPLFSQAVTQGILQAVGELGNGRAGASPTTRQTDSVQFLESDLTVDRREATKHIGSLLTLFATPDALFSLQPLFQLADAPKGANVDEEMLDSYAKLNEICRQLSEGNDLQTAERLLWSYLPNAMEFAQRLSEHQRLAASITTQGYLLAASLAGHRNDLRARKQLSEQALRYADLAHDPALHVAALRQLALTFDYLERPDKVTQTYEQTVPFLNAVSPLLRSCVYAGMSGAYAQQHQQQEADHFLGLAYEHFPETSGNEAGFLQITCRLSTLIFWEGLNHLAFDRPAEAEKVFARIDGMHPKMPLPERVRAELLSYQAQTFTALQDMEQACAYLEAAVQAAVAIGSKIRLQESLTVFQQMWSLWRHEPSVQALVDLIMQASGALY